MNPAVKAWHLFRHFGPGWLAFRARYALEQRLGQLERRMPVSDWGSPPLARHLADPALADPDAYARYRRSRAPRFFFQPGDRDRYAPLLRQWDASEGRAPQAPNSTPRRGELRKPQPSLLPFDGASSASPGHPPSASSPPDPTPAAAAGRMLAGEFAFFEHTWHRCGNPPDWFLNPFTGQRLQADAHWSRVRTFAHGDIKCIWELSRFAFAYTLVRAWWRDADPRWPGLFWKVVEDWRAQNPPNRGPQWMCGQETAFRVMAWCFALHGLADAPATTPARVAMLAEMLAVSGDRIAGNLGYALSQQNNHGISEALGLWTLGTLFPEFRRATEWEAAGRRWLERLGRDLIYDDGGFSQHSANYHRVMLHDYAWVLRLGDLNDRPFSTELKSRVARAAEFLYQVQDEASGGVPCFGSNDGALVLPLSNCDYTDHRPVLEAALFSATGRLAYAAGPWDEETLWLHGLEALNRERQSPPRTDLCADEAGYYTLRGGDSFALIHCPRRFRHRPAHADLLHVDLWWRGVNLALDPGSYSYNAAPPFEGALKETRLHNTVSVEGLDQMARAGRFLWLPWARGRPAPTQRSSRVPLAVWEGAHDGYCRLSQPARHWRAVVWLGELGWVVLDAVESSAPRSSALHWLLPAVAEEIPGTVATFRIPAAGEMLELRAGGFGNPTESNTAVAPADSPRGWRSAYYQQREPARALQLATTATVARYWTHIGPADVALVAGEDVLELCNPGAAARVTFNPERRFWVRYEDTASKSTEAFKSARCTRS